MTLLWVATAVLATLLIVAGFALLYVLHSAGYFKDECLRLAETAGDLKTQLAETQKRLELAELRLAETHRMSVGQSNADPLQLANPTFILREWIGTALGLVWVDKHVEFRELQAHLDTSLRNGGMFMVRPAPTAPDDRDL